MTVPTPVELGRGDGEAGHRARPGRAAPLVFAKLGVRSRVQLSNLLHTRQRFGGKLPEC
ncbi:hypothetical protein [Kutzneria sp. NPDC052558]|uniref:hypothetical protein n=1 Tax=Kutzneria sp. NPDC052558 TaxID=3364121 RepID=UPI0037C55B91